jgi:hypothetical protein
MVRDYSGTDNAGMSASLGSVADGYDLFANKDEIEVDFLLMGRLDAQLKQNLKQKQTN